MTLKAAAKFKGKIFVWLENLHKRIWLIFMRAVESLKICTLVGIFV